MLATMDNENKNNISLLLEYLREQFGTTIIISHLQELQELVDNTIVIKRMNEMSSVNNGKSEKIEIQFKQKKAVDL